ncbi:MAG: hypothetical protein J6Q30_04320, partial [Oscillospiraceae bacterium]|nr:hypothetical protein [Oscillospiraceae bacterium]
AVGEVLTSSVKNRLKAPVFATFPKGEGLGGCAAEERINPFPTPRQTGIGIISTAAFVMGLDKRRI